jgi:Ca2+-binding RTX toxin-like protein
MPQEATGAGPLIDAKNQELRSYLNETLGVRAFEMTEPQVNAVFDLVAAPHLTAIDSLIPEPSLERLALISLHFNNPALIGSGVQAALATANPYDARAEAWYQIRYAHANQLHMRRFLEAGLFSLYGDGVPDGDAVAQAEAIYRMYARHGRAETMRGTGIDMVAYETRFAAQRQQAQRNLSAAGFIDVHVQALRDELAPAAVTLIQHYITDAGITNAPTIDPLNVQVAYDDAALTGEDTTSRTGYNSDFLIGREGATDILSGLGGSDVLVGLGGNDYLAGGSGDDTLLGGAGNDTLYGGGGNDVYLWRPGDDFDTVIDSAAIDGDGLGQIRFQKSDGSWVDLSGQKTQLDPTNPKLFTDANGFFYALTGNPNGGADLYITEPDAPGGVRIQGFTSGNLSITLGPVAPIEKSDQAGTGDADNLNTSLMYERVFGFGGNDRIVVSTPQSEGHGGDGKDYITNDGSGDQYLYGDAGTDILVADVGSDVLDGGAGNDVVDGGAGDDFMLGGGSVAPNIVAWDPDNVPVFGVLVQNGDVGLLGMTGALAIDGEIAVWGGSRPVAGRSANSLYAHRVPSA